MEVHAALQHTHGLIIALLHHTDRCCKLNALCVHARHVQVVAEVYAAQDVVVKPHILLSLVLYKIVDPAQVFRHPCPCVTLPSVLHYMVMSVFTVTCLQPCSGGN